MDNELKLLNEITKKINSELNYKNEITEDELKNLRTHTAKGDEIIRQIDTIFKNIAVDERTNYKREIDSAKGAYKNIKHIIEKKETQQVSKKDKLKEPLLNNQVKRYDQANDTVKREIKTTVETVGNLQVGTQELQRQQEQMLKNIQNTQDIEESLTLSDQYFAMTKNKAMFNKLKLFFIVFMFLIGDLLMLYIKLK